ncbi:citrate lyase subunit alpha [Fusobacterium sp. MFO224]|uniref:citrate lyase subunit alpha n=1 Tax=Fusobacterium sp. MFO224 TaxID=3378070 RepID=UPI0038519154
MKNSNKIPDFIKGYGKVNLYENNGAKEKLQNKVLKDIQESIVKSNLMSGMTISFQTNHRNNNNILNLIIEEIDRLKINDIHLVVSSLGKIHEPLIEYIKKGVITKISTSGIRGEIAREISINSILKNPVIFRSSGNKVNSVILGKLKIDVAFLITSACDPMGNSNGIEGKSAFGSTGYSMTDMKFANKVVIITDNIVPFPIENISIPMEYVDYVVKIKSLTIGTNFLNSIRLTKNPRELIIAEKAAELLIKLGYIKNGFSIQPGPGGAFLALCKYLKEYMNSNEIKGSFLSGGISSYLVNLLEEGYFENIFDLQSYDVVSAKSLLNNKKHMEVSDLFYDKILSNLDIAIVNATEIDVNFNINLLTGSNGIIMGVPTVAQDIAHASKITLAISPTMRKRIPIITKKVSNIVIPGEDVDILVTERGICINPLRKDLIKILKKEKVELTNIKKLYETVTKITGIPKKPTYTDKIIGVIESSDGKVIDIIKQVKK